MSHPFLDSGLKGHHSTAQGKALGAIRFLSQALKGRHRPAREHLVSPIQGLGLSGFVPRALPWAIEWRPVGAGTLSLGALMMKFRHCLRGDLGWAVLFALAVLLPHSVRAQTNTNKPTLIVLSGAGGEEDFGKVFLEAAQSWKRAAERADVNLVEIGTADAKATNDLELFRATLDQEPTNTLTELWIVMLGHGTFDGREAKFNLHGPDLSASTLSNLLAGFRRPVAIINAASCSAPFIKALARKDRVIVTATRSGSEENYTRFNRYISQAIADPEADLDKDGQTSLLEAFLMASRRVTEFYKSEGRLATEHALLDDNGDGLGVQADWFRGIHAVKKAANNAALDGTRAHQWHLVRSKEDQKLTPEQRQKRDALELEIGKLRDQKSKMNEDEYYKQLEALLTKLGEIELH